MASDAQLISRTVEGDESAFDALVSKYRTRAYYLALSRLRDREAAMDIAQEAFVQAYISLRTLRDPAKFPAWLSSIVSNLSLMRLRRPREIAMPADALDALNGHTTGAEYDLDAAVARQAIDALPNGTRSAAILYFVEEMKLTEIAEFLGISLAAVKSRVREARVRLQKEMIDVVRRTAKKEEPGDEFNRSLDRKLELARLYREFSGLIERGVNLMRALDTIRGGNYSEPLKRAVGELMSAVEAGSTLSDAMAKAPEFASPIEVVLVKAGEIGGMLEWSARILADMVEMQTSQRQIEISVWCRSLGGMLSAGVPIMQALRLSVDIAQSPELKQATRDMIETIGDGQSLRTVVEKHSDVLPPIVRAAIVAGEWSGTLDYGINWAGAEVAAEFARMLGPREYALPFWMSRQEYHRCLDTFNAAVGDMLSSESSAMRAASAVMLGRAGAREMGPQIADLLDDENAEVRKAAIGSLVALDYTASADRLTGCLDDHDPLVRLAAVQAVSAMHLADAAPDLARAISDTDLRVSNTAVRALEATQDNRILAAHVRELLRSEVGFGVLTRNATPEVIDGMIAALGDEEPDLATSAALALAKLGRAESVPVLLTLLRTVGHVNIWKASDAALALADLGHPQAVPVLTRVLEYPHPCILQGRAARRLGEIGDHSAAPHIRKAIEDGRLGPGFAEIADRLEAKQS